MEFLKICFFFMLLGVQKETLSQVFMMIRQRLARKTENVPISNIGTLWQTPLKMEILKICFFHVTRGPKIGIEPNFHEHTTSNVKDYPGKPKRQNRPKKGGLGTKKGVKSRNSKIGLRSALSWTKTRIE